MAKPALPRVIIADDEAHIRLMLKRTLASIQYTVVGEATNGNEAVELFRKEKPDLLLLDINMPFKTGDKVISEIMAEFPDAMIVMLTSVSDLESVETCLGLGAANFIRKDTPLSEIKSMIAETWEEASGGGDA